MGLFKIPAEIDGKRVFIKCHILEAPIPLLFSKESMKKAGVNLDFVNDRMLFQGSWVALEDLGVGHYGLNNRPRLDLVVLFEEC